MEHEATHIATLLFFVGVLMVVSAVLGRVSSRLGVPAVLVFLAIGMIAGSEGIGGIAFEDYALTYRLGTVALVAILFDGGLNTSLADVRRVAAPASVLATLGVLVTAAVFAAGAHVFGFAWPEALLLGAIVSSTDAAAVFSVLRGSGLHVAPRAAATLELESGLNDPMAVILTTSLAEVAQHGGALSWHIAAEVAKNLVVGLAIGAGVGVLARRGLARLRLVAAGLYPVVTLSCAFVAFGGATLLEGSGFLAVYVAAVLLGQGHLPYRTALLRVHDFVAWFSQIVMFLALGLLVFPHRLLAVAPVGLGLALLLVLVARPVAVLVSLLPFRYPLRETAFVGWLGLRGAVPIILATLPVIAGVRAGTVLFDVVFFVVVVSALVQGGTARLVTRKLRLESPAPPEAAAVLELTSSGTLPGEVLTYYVTEGATACGARLEDLAFPPQTALMLVVRGEALVAARGGVRLEAGDHVFVFSPEGEKGQVDALFAVPGDMDRRRATLSSHPP